MWQRCACDLLTETQAGRITSISTSRERYLLIGQLGVSLGPPEWLCAWVSSAPPPPPPHLPASPIPLCLSVCISSPVFNRSRSQYITYEDIFVSYSLSILESYCSYTFRASLHGLLDWILGWVIFLIFFLDLFEVYKINSPLLVLITSVSNQIGLFPFWKRDITKLAIGRWHRTVCGYFSCT